MPLQATSGAASYDAFGGGVAAVPQYIEDVFSTYLVTGDGTAPAVNNGIDLSTKGGLVWTKKRSAAGSHSLFDTARGANLRLISNDTAAQDSVNLSFTTTGFSNYTFDSGVTYASWTFRKQPKFFDVVTYTGNGTNGRTVAHSLGSTPGCIIVKRTDAANGWAVYHRAMNASPQDYMMRLNATDAAFTTSPSRWNNTLPTSTEFTLSGNDEVNGSGATYVAYLFAHDAGGFGLTGTDNVISCGSFTTGSGGKISAPVNLGYEAQWLLAKNVDSAENWVMYDIMRGMNNTGYAALNPNTSGAEYTGTSAIAPTATGFNTPNASGPFASFANYIYIAIRRGPMRVPTSGTSVFSVESYNQTSASDPAFNLGKVADAGLRRLSDFEDSWRFQSRLTANGGLITSSTAAESTMNYGKWDNNVGWYQGASITPPYSQANWYGWTFARAPSFFDEVCYTGTNSGGSSQTIPHNLGVAPELLIFKKRSATSNWTVVMPAIGGNAVSLNLNDYGGNSNIQFIDTFGTSSITTASGYDNLSESGSTYVAYLFATCAGVSKVGNYTGTGAALTVNCGFTSGARFVMIKRLDGTNIYRGWYVWDSARGITSGNDPYLLLNETSAETTGTNYVDSASSGFTLTADSAGASGGALNASGGTYIFLAIA